MATSSLRAVLAAAGSTNDDFVVRLAVVSLGAGAGAGLGALFRVLGGDFGSAASVSGAAVLGLAAFALTGRSR